MGKLSLASRLQVDDVASKWEDSRETVISSLGEMQDGVTTLLNGTLSTRDNTSSDYGDYTLTHNTPVRIKNPLQRGDTVVPVKGIYAVKCVGVEVSNGKPTRKLYSLATPRIDWALADSDSNNLIVTAAFPPPPGRLRLALSANQTGIVSGTGTPIAWTTERATATAFTHSTSASQDVITCTQSGVLSILFQVAWVSRTAVAGDYVSSWVLKNAAASGADTRHGFSRLGQGTTVNATNGAAEFDVTAGDTIQIVAQQGNSLAATMDLQGNGNNETYACVQYSDSAATTTGRVTLFFFGG